VLGNYDITYNTANFAINKAPLTITAKSDSKTYGNLYTFDGTEFTTSALVSGDSVDSVALISDGAAAGATVGPYDIVITPDSEMGTGLSNYAITYGKGTLTVATKLLTITANDASKTYGDTVIFAGTEFSTIGLLSGDIVTSVTLTSAGAAATATVAGSPYDIVPSNAVGTGLNGYAITYVDGTLTVDKAALTVTADAKAKAYGETDPALTYQITSGSLVGSDSFTGALSRAAGEDVGGYAIDQDTLALSSNYDLTYVGADLTVNPVALTITAKDDTKTYDGVAYSGGNGVDYSGFITGEDETVLGGLLTYSGSSQGAVDAGDYIITPEGLTSDNYDIDFEDGTLTVDPAAFTPSINQQELLRYKLPYLEQFAPGQVNPFDFITSSDLYGPVFFYHPLTESDSSAFAAMEVGADAYEFINGALNLLGHDGLLRMFDELDSKKKNKTL
jgi:hypothetical protein